MSPRKKSNRKPPVRRSTKREGKKKGKDAGFFVSAFKKNFTLSSVLLICVIGFLAYSNTFHAEMQFDDGLQIVSKDHINDFSHFASLSDWVAVNKRPLSNFGFALNYYFGGYGVRGYHVVNLIIHLLSALLVFFLAGRVFAAVSEDKPSMNPGHKELAALFAALIFVAHPIQTQGVTYIVQRMTSQSAMFYLFAVLFYALGRAGQLSGDRRKALLFYAATFVSFTASLLSKQIAVTLPFALLLYEFFFVRDKQGEIFIRYIIISLAVLSIGIVYVLFSGMLPAETDEISRYEYLLTQFRVVVKYFQLLVLPIQQNVDYSFSISKSVWGWKELTSFFFLLGILGLAIRLIRKRPVVSFGVFWIFLTLSVESSIIPISDVIFEHRLYLPMFGFAIVVTDLVLCFLGERKKKPALIILAVLVLILSFATYSRNNVWRTQYSLWQDAMEKSPDKTRPLFNLIYLYSKDGRHREAVQYAAQAIALDPQDGKAYFNAGTSNEKAGNTEQAIKYYKKGIEIDKENRKAMNNLGNIYLRTGKYKLAEKYFLMALNETKKQTAVLKNLVLTYYKLKEYDNSIKYAKIYLRSDPDDVIVLSKLGSSYLSLRKTGQAIRVYEKILTINPQRVSTYNNLGTCYYYKGNYKKAAHYYSEALRIDPGNEKAKGYLLMTKRKLQE
ncbi:MAG: tetratricopeptide repeat protein [Bacteroidales bacterium]|nr:tetratricopeptide repeat protein [Bacteroidales bacterium]